ncbi:hypothetical protein LSAT2_029734 [Lamellibrachia satsuma]|nr:hypothetical protein LSAT2_029734 [Lamellibrachia satsuma]
MRKQTMKESDFVRGFVLENLYCGHICYGEMANVNVGEEKNYNAERFKPTLGPRQKVDNRRIKATSGRSGSLKTHNDAIGRLVPRQFRRVELQSSDFGDDQEAHMMNTVDTSLDRKCPDDVLPWYPEDADEERERKKTPQPEPDPEVTTSISRYRTECKQLGIRPSSRFIKQIGRGAVCLCSEQLDRKAMRAVCTTLMSQGCSCVYSFDLSGNSLGDRELGYLSQLLKKNPGIRQLVDFIEQLRP